MKQRAIQLLMRCLSSVLIAFFILVLTCHYAVADIYDDFNGVGIDGNKWMIHGDKFSQPGDGFLHFSATGATFQILVSKNRFSSGVFTMSFIDYSCDNNAPPDRGLGSIVGLGLGTSVDYVRIERGQVRPGLSGSTNTGGYIEVNWIVPGEPGSKVHVSGIPSEITSGFLQIRYDGTQVSFFYRASFSDTWIQVGPVLTPGWKNPVPIFIQALPGGTKSDRYSLRFKSDSVEASPITVSSQEGGGGLTGIESK